MEVGGKELEASESSPECVSAELLLPASKLHQGLTSFLAPGPHHTFYTFLLPGIKGEAYREEDSEGPGALSAKQGGKGMKTTFCLGNDRTALFLEVCQSGENWNVVNCKEL
ncbi:hypothetical protein STEG23_034122 [Scotinomys teguina]